MPDEWILVTEPHFEVRAGLTERTIVFSGTQNRHIVVSPNVTTTLIEVHDHPAQETNFQTLLEIHPFANVQHIRMQVQPRGTQHKSHLLIQQAQSSLLNALTLNIGGESAVVATDIQQNGAESESNIWGLFLAMDGQSLENRVSVCHTQPQGVSRQRFKGLVAEGAKARFFGKIRIEKHAQKVDSRQSCATLICGRRADMQTQPELEILADDVKAAHGASIGQMNADEIFYLRSRGLSVTQAVRLIARGFMDEILLQIRGQDHRSFVIDQIKRSLESFEEHFVQSMERL
jgi:Fe-S cluster assembly protein SufD